MEADASTIEASTIEEWAPQLASGLLQTEDYARAGVRARAALLGAAEPPEFWVILGESVLRRCGPAEAKSFAVLP
ncbi:hypothetical protein GCM10009801_21050 [Streptomyces albiaxialis]|uniref:DUF5753 domain-containing protein n=1 Tax=Streptomyces albiaxialis TaxID=329523 RepID=A0ABN2VSQ9_9ACTN